MPVGKFKPVARDGELVLYADKSRKRGKLHDTNRDIWSDEQELQVFFKWGNFEPIEEPTRARR